MKSTVKTALFAAALPAILSLTATEALSKISWIKGYDRGMRMAMSEGKPAMLDFTAKWCGWCVKLEKDTFTDSTVRELGKSFVCVKVDMDKDREKAQQWSIRGIPHILFLTPDGKLLGHISGYKGPAEFAREMKNALAKYTPVNTTAAPKRRKKSSAPAPSGADSEPIFIECAKCGNIFNSTTLKGECPSCGTPYKVK